MRPPTIPIGVINLVFITLVIIKIELVIPRSFPMVECCAHGTRNAGYFDEINLYQVTVRYLQGSMANLITFFSSLIARLMLRQVFFNTVYEPERGAVDT